MSELFHFVKWKLGSHLNVQVSDCLKTKRLSVCFWVLPFAEDNFFGPVSASFIRPGRLSDSAASDEIHEETLDTTAFSMHYRSLARSDSGELKTPTVVRLVFEDKTATKDPNRTDSGSSMTLTEPKRLSSQSPVFLKRVRGGENSDDDMSIVGESSKGYDYGALSPTLDALLAEGSKDLTKIGSEFLRSDQNVMNYMDSINGRDSELGNLDTNENLVEAASISHSKLPESNGGSRDQTSVDYPSMRNSGVTAGASNHQIRSPSKLISVWFSPLARFAVELWPNFRLLIFFLFH